MKTITKILIFFSVAVFSSCEGPIGPPGRDGVDGLDGLDAEIATIFETTVDFEAQDNYTVFFEFPNDFMVYNSDIVMVYILWEQAETDDGVLDVWRALPQTIFLDEGIIQYNFDYTTGDVKIFIEETVGNLLSSETDNQTFRIAVIPAVDYLNKSVKLDDMNSIMKNYKIEDSSVVKVPVK